ncbi:large ribosomal subunit protein mL62 [Takifugu rubripes]|uniref:Large ribosomal subunit protein mL62 n=2 Tax=Takifugu TaxID=31032 RepID=A0A674PRV8_TAKRU|nr:peptidyl-tRNA hydrolase ICT1, mitochondrial [Takifugu rubripes]XP_056913472.1 peptidyl-tRNA hydrolase ICT1, mitochondrial [Takifugu flavidus]TWW81660.1 Peptidyl-tRNA hydrolase ICT1, mitochondrial [Takifugu flavidus]|eukprot:XP_011616819.1 PREDICTED: peptidyl-tRNA hydrolase ICT1, mitochondrial [Takifugu rubripes]
MNRRRRAPSNMAAHIARYLFCRRAGLNLIPQHIKQLTDQCLMVHNKNTSQWSVGCSSRGPNSVQSAQVQIPIERLTISYSRSSGPGGQHVNKVSTKAEVRFNVHTADWIPEDVRQKIIEKNKNHINKAGELLVTSELSRSQQRNLSDCIQRIAAIIAKASEKPHEPTAEDVALRATRLEKRNKDRLNQKRMNAVIKKSRRVDLD